MFVRLPERQRNQIHWATPSLVLISVLAFLWLVGLDDAARGRILYRWGAMPEQLLPAGVFDLSGYRHWATLFSTLFIHADWLHLVGNLLFLLIFGLPAERGLGGLRLLLLFLFAGAAANAAAVLLVDVPRAVIIGSSGAVSALVGAYLALFPRARLGFVLPLGMFLEFVRTPAPVMIGAWAILQVVFSVVGPSFGAVAWSAHVAGFIIGFLYGLVARSSLSRRWRAQA
ncbi:rhomboid family intramembrane serine protease [Pseudomarimonas arenosa]|uniref:Rhomboid family intramembrane serine protease n=1 Tax=Pseudomarimonas arenosa TaxID=2774145 RepID=A0AAW3ZHX3_9GAMM|nr:rhomboid family intramembrane serine protease [Pseudomarimonas arenosa]MBD8524302.1 rhomboid family intramembrane serine protease [Pseudomarimonas arenosa]